VAEEELREQNESLQVANEILERERQRYRELFDFAPDGYLVTTASGIIQEANRAAADLFNVPAQFLIGKPLSVYIAGIDRTILYEQLWRLRAVQEREERIVHVQPRDRAAFDATLTAAPISDRAGSVVGIRWLLRDITEQKRTEAALRKLNEELERRVEARTAELRRSNQELQQFAYVVSHDLQEPLRMVRSYVQILAERYRGRFDADADEFIGYTVEGATHMQQLIVDLLEYSRVQTRERETKATECEEILTYVLSNLRTAIEESGAVVTHDPLPVVFVDASQLRQVSQNLLGNALKFRSQEPPRIHIAAERRGEHWVFSVRDNGIGIDPRQAERIFGIFQRLHTRREYSGTGLGLAICRRIIENHGGRIWVESELGKGATFYFALPVGGE
jgi:PAS domain S-box-containing protein